METLTVHLKNKSKSNTLKAILKALKISFKEEKPPYNTEFVAKINRSMTDFKLGKFKSIKTKELLK